MTGDCKEPDVCYYFSALINAINSIPDYVLEEANVHFSLNIPDNSRSIRGNFQSLIKNTNDQELKTFYSTWTEYKNELGENPIFQYRHLNIHRRNIPVTRGIYISNCPYNIEDEILEKYRKYFSNNEGWAASGYFDLTQYVDDVESISEVYDLDPYLKDESYRVADFQKAHNMVDDYYLFTSYFLRGEVEIFDPISIISFKLMKLSYQFIDMLHSNFNWLEPL